MSFFFKKQQKTTALPEIQFELVLGGFYTYRHADKKYHILRLIDIDDKRVHYMMYDSDFIKKPVVADAIGKQPVIAHIPQPLSAMFDWQDLTLLQPAALTNEDVAGYKAYLLAFGRSPEYVQKYLSAVITHSGKPYTIALRREADTVSVKVVR